MNRYYYGDSVEKFLGTPDEHVLGVLTSHHEFNLELAQRDVWQEQIILLKQALVGIQGKLYLEFTIPRMGRRVDAILLMEGVLFVLEFKGGAREYARHAIDQVFDYALDLKNFHLGSRDAYLLPVLVATNAEPGDLLLKLTPHQDRTFFPVSCNPSQLAALFNNTDLPFGHVDVMSGTWETGGYSPTPTIVEAAIALYGGHAVSEISRNDACATNLSITSKAVSEIIESSRATGSKSICFVTGVPGAGKTLVGLNIATKYMDTESQLHSVFLSGNGPLVAILQEALARDQVERKKQQGKRARKGEARSEVKLFVQNVHHFRDDCLKSGSAPIEHVVLFDEAQRAWNLKMTTDFMRRKKGKDFSISEPEYLISCMDRHPDWAVIVCLVGGGQEINTGEAGIGEWLDALMRSYPDWNIYLSERLTDSEYGAVQPVHRLHDRAGVHTQDALHLAVSMRSYRAEHVSTFVKNLLDIDHSLALAALGSVKAKYPICLTRDIGSAKRWLRAQARGTERYGIAVSSQAERLRPHAIHVKSPVDPVNWFLNSREDTRSSYYLEDVATEFHIQGLELDWVCVAWDADFRYCDGQWEHWSFVGCKWNHIHSKERQIYQKNAYRVLLTRARQGMVIVVPEGDSDDPTRHPSFYDGTYDYLRGLGVTELV